MFRRNFTLSPADTFPSQGVIKLLLITQGATLLLHAMRVPVWLTILCFVLLSWRFWRLRSGERDLLSNGVKNSLAVALVAIFGVSNGLNFTVEAAIAFFLLTYSLKLLELKSYRDAFVFAVLSLFLIILVFLYGQSLLEVSLVLVSIVLPLAALLALQDAEPGSAGWLKRFSAGARILGWAIPLLIFIYVVFPRVGPLWAMPLKSNSAFTGLSEKMTPGMISDLAGLSSRAFRVVFNGSPPPKSELYWRAILLDGFDGRTWYRSGLQSGREIGLYRTGAPLPPGPQGSWDYEVAMEPHNQVWGFTLKNYVMVDESPRLSVDGTLLFRDSQESLTRYRMVQGEWPEEDPGQWRLTRLPEGVNPQTRALVQELRARHADDESYIQAWLSLFREQPFFYTLKPPLLPGEHTIDQFLFETRQGFCEHYAGAMTFALRAAGIPARVVTGYMGGEYNSSGNFWAVFQYDAHAWVEAWVEGRGWLRIDPTGAVAPQRIESGLRAALADDAAFLENEPLSLARLSNYSTVAWLRNQLEYMNYLWHDTVVLYDQNRQSNLFSRWFGENKWKRILGLLGVLAVGILVLFAGALLYGKTWRRRPPVALRPQWILERKLRRAGIPVPPGSLTPAELLSYATPRLASGREGLKAVLEEYQALTYSRSSAGEDVSEKRRALERRIKSLRLKRLRR